MKRSFMFPVESRAIFCSMQHLYLYTYPAYQLQYKVRLIREKYYSIVTDGMNHDLLKRNVYSSIIPRVKRNIYVCVYIYMYI